MKIEELEEKLDGVFDLTDIDDCREVIQTLLRDNQRRCEEGCSDKLKMLAKMVMSDNPRAKELAQTIEGSTKKKSAKALLDFFARMSNSVRHAKSLNNEKLIDAVLGIWGGLLMDSVESAVLEEIIERFKKATAKKGKK